MNAKFISSFKNLLSIVEELRAKKNVGEKISEHTLLIDETGIDGKSCKVSYVGCLMESSLLEDIKQRIVDFNQEALNHPARSNKKSWVNCRDEARHYAEDHFTLREEFIWKVLTKIPCRVYVTTMDYQKDDINDIKRILMTELIKLASATRRVKNLKVIAEHGEVAFESDFHNVVFKDKSFLPLSIADYYAGGIKAFHELRLNLETNKNTKKDESSLDMRFYEILVNKIAFEYDLTTKESSSRRNRIFLEKVKKLYNNKG